jgi:hypothetical protein
MRFAGITILKVVGGKIVEENGLDDGVKNPRINRSELGLIYFRVRGRSPWAGHAPSPIQSGHASFLRFPREMASA